MVNLVAFLVVVSTVVLLFAEPHLYDRFGRKVTVLAFNEVHAKMGRPVFKSFKAYELVLRASIVLPLGVLLVIVAISIVVGGVQR